MMAYIFEMLNCAITQYMNSTQHNIVSLVDHEHVQTVCIHCRSR